MAKAPTRRPRKKTLRKAKAGTRGVSAAETKLENVEGEAASVRDYVEKEGGQVIGAYNDPLGRNPLIFAVLPIDKVEPTPFQRDVSDMHHKRLAHVIDKTGYFLDPIIAITAPKEGFWTPNGGHRLAAMRRLGARSIAALVVPRREVAWQILALNTEKVHTLKDKSLEVIRIYRGLLDEDARRPESQFAYYLDEPSFVTMGLCYEKNPRFSGGVYNSFVRRLSTFSDDSLTAALKNHQKTAEMLMELDAKVIEVVKKLQAKGFKSPYLKTFVVARCNPLRFMKEAPELEDLIKTIRGKVERFNVEKVRQEDIVASGGAAEDGD